MRPVPTPSHRAWADAEIGVIIHLDVQVFEPTYKFREQRGYTPPASVFNPHSLDTDQWISTANEVQRLRSSILTSIIDQ